jgi:hypothetical protein
MNCCDTYGNCTQGRDCPVRSSRITSAQAGEAARLMDAARIQEARRVPRPQSTPSQPPPEPTRNDTADGIPDEVGNVWFVDSELTPLSEFEDPTAWCPLSTKETLIISGLATCFLLPWVVLIAMGLGYVFERLAA